MTITSDFVLLTKKKSENFIAPTKDVFLYTARYIFLISFSMQFMGCITHAALDVLNSTVEPGLCLKDKDHTLY